MAEKQEPYKHMHTETILTTVELGIRTVRELTVEVARGDETGGTFPEVDASKREALGILHSQQKS